jgi:hypothetical protein
MPAAYPVARTRVRACMAGCAASLRSGGLPRGSCGWSGRSCGWPVVRAGLLPVIARGGPDERLRALPPAAPPWAGRTRSPRSAAPCPTPCGAAAIRRAAVFVIRRALGRRGPPVPRVSVPRVSVMRVAAVFTAGRRPDRAASREPFARGVAGNTACLAWVLWDEQPAVGERFTHVTHCTRGVARRTGYHAEGKGHCGCPAPTAL